MNGYIKYFDDGGKNMNVVKGLLKLKFAASPIRNDKYIY